jgi:hypothetical protein
MAKSVLPDAARVLPPAGQKIWISAFKDGQSRGMPDDEASAFAWAAVKRAGYHQVNGGKWGKSMDNVEFTFDGDKLVIGVPITKINAEKRTVEGFATLDNIDKAGDVVDYSASVDAFANWAGNIREMHQKVAVGRAVEITEKTLEVDGETYQGIWVKARISKGAEDTWQKVLDGTLAGFSIGGAVQEKKREVAKLADGVRREIWRITKYALGELSLVDNPCNGLARVSMAKSVDGVLHIEDVVDEGELFEKAAHMDGTDECCGPEVESTISALEAWRDKAISNEQDYLVSRISDLLGSVRSYQQSDEYEHMYAEQDAAAQKSNEFTEKEEIMSKSEEILPNNEITDNSSSTELTDEDKSLFRKFVEFVKGETTVSEETETEEIVKEETPDMNEELVKSEIAAAIATTTEATDAKFSEVTEALTKVSELLETLVKSDALDAVKTAVEESVAALATRIEAIEASGAVKKSAEVTGEEVIEKSETSTGLWSDSIVPANLRKQMEF